MAVALLEGGCRVASVRDVATVLWACKVGNEKYRLEDKAANSPDICEAA